MSVPARSLGVVALARRLPDVATVLSWSRSLAVLETVLCPGDEHRLFSFDAAWGPGQVMASMDNGSGDDYSLVVTPAGAFLRGFAHEMPLSPFARTPPAAWPGLLDDVPPELAEVAAEPAFALDGVPLGTVALWRLPGDDAWRHGTPRALPAGVDGELDGASHLFALLDGDPASYVAFAEEYHEVELDGDAVAAVYAHRPLTAGMVLRLDPGADVDAVLGEVASTGYPVAGR